MKTATLAVTLVVIFAALITIGYVAVASAAEVKAKTVAAMPMADPKVELRLAMRDLWVDHASYTRDYITSSLAGLEDVNVVAERLLKNQDDIGNAVKPFYGEEAGKRLSTLLRNHITIASDVVNAAKEGKSEDLTKNQAAWRANADEIAAFLSAANPNWVKKDLTDMLYVHLDLTTGELVSRLSKNWAADIDNYDKGRAHLMKLADYLTEGVIKQFPDKFKK